MKNLQKLRFVILLVILMLLTFIGFASEQYTLYKPTPNGTHPLSTNSYTITVMNDTELHQIVGNGNYEDMTVQDFNRLMSVFEDYEVDYVAFYNALRSTEQIYRMYTLIFIVLIISIAAIALTISIRDSLKYKKMEMKDFTIYVKRRDFNQFKEYVESLKNKQ